MDIKILYPILIVWKKIIPNQGFRGLTRVFYCWSNYLRLTVVPGMQAFGTPLFCVVRFSGGMDYASDMSLRGWRVYYIPSHWNCLYSKGEDYYKYKWEKVERLSHAKGDV